VPRVPDAGGARTPRSEAHSKQQETLAGDRLAKVSKVAIDAGIAERQVANAERLGSRIGRVLQAVFADLDLSEVQLAIAPESVRRHLRLLESTR
jgi:hypothetical protein